MLERWLRRVRAEGKAIPRVPGFLAVVDRELLPGFPKSRGSWRRPWLQAALPGAQPGCLLGTGWLPAVRGYGRCSRIEQNIFS